MICDKCGATVPEDSLICPFCGLAIETDSEETPVEEPSTQEPVTEEAPVEGAENLPEHYEWMAQLTDEGLGANEDENLTEEEWAAMFAPKKRMKGIWIVLITLLVTLGLAAGAFFLFHPNVITEASTITFQGYVDDYHALMLNGDMSGLESLAPKAYWDTIEATYGMTPADIIKNETCIKNLEEYVKGSREYCATTYGENWNYTVEVLCHHKYNADTLENMKTSLQQIYGIDPALVTELQSLHVESLVTGNIKDVFAVDDMYAIQVDGTWYLMDSQGMAVDYMLKNVILSGVPTLAQQQAQNQSQNQSQSTTTTTKPNNDSGTNSTELEWD